MHPSRNLLLDYLQAALPEDQSQSVVSHLEACPECDATLRQIEADSDTLVQALRQAQAQPDPLAQESGCQRMLERIEALGPAPAAAAADAAAGLPLPAQIGLYQLLEKLGEGGMGAVYKARHAKLDKLVAVKILPKERMHSADAVARFEREMRAVGKLDDPHLIRAHDAGEVEGTHFLVMEYVPGQDVASLAKALGALPLAEACELVRQAALGLQYAHENGLIHRDIKPSNLMLTPNGRVKILDLGLALLQDGPAPAGELTTEGQMMGTLDYMAPEQGSDSHEVSPAADLYSLGATLYRLLVGQAPFASKQFDTPVKKLMALATQAPRPVAELRPDTPRALSDFVGRLLAKEPAERPASAAEVAQFLVPFAEGANLAGLSSPAPGVEQGAAGIAPTLPPSTSPSRAARGTSPSRARQAPAPAPAAQGRGGARARWWLAAAAAGAILCAGVWIIIKDKDGNELARVKAPEGSTAVVVPETPAAPATGPAVAPPGSPPPRPAPAVSPAPVAPAASPDDSAAPARLGTWPVPAAAAQRQWTTKIMHEARLPGLPAWELAFRADARSFQISPDGRWGTVGGVAYQSHVVYDLASWKPVVILPNFERPAWSPDGRSLMASIYTGAVGIFDSHNGFTVTHRWKCAAPIQSGAWSPDGAWLAFALNNATLELRRPEGELVRTIRAEGKSAPYGSVAWNPDSSQFLWSPRPEGPFQIWNVDGTPGPKLEGASGTQVAWGRAGVIAVRDGGGEGGVQFWQVDGTPGAKVKVPNLGSLAFSPDGRLLAVARDGGMVQFRNADGSPAGLPIQVSKFNYGVQSVVWHPDGDRVFVSGGEGINEVSVDGRIRRIVLPLPRFTAVDANPAGTRVVAGDSEGCVRLLDGRGGLLRSWRLETGRSVTCVRWSPDGERFVVGSEDGKARLYDAAGEPGPAWQASAKSVTRAAWDPESQRLATGGEDQAVRIWDLTGTIQKVLAGHEAPVTSLTWSRQGKLASTDSRAGAVRVWNLETGQATAWGEGVAADWTADGRELATVHPQGKLRRFDAEGELLGEFAIAPEAKFLLWSPDGRSLILSAHRGSFSQPLEVFRITPAGQVQRQFPGSGRNFWSAAGLLVACDGATLRVADGATGAPRWVAVSLAEGKTASFTAAGELLQTDADAEVELQYLVQRDADVWDVLKHSEFTAKVETALAADAARRARLPQAAERQAAEYALALGARLQCRVEGKTIDVRSVAALPETSFAVVEYKLESDQSGDHLGREAWAHLAQFPHLTKIELPVCSETDAVAAFLAGLPSLRYVRIAGWLSDEGLRALAGLQLLERLQCDAGQITDEGLSHLRRAPQLRGLILDNAWHVTDAGLAPLEFPNLGELIVTRAKNLTNAGLEKIATQQSVYRLGLKGTGITDAGLQRLAPLVKLAELDVSETKVTRAGLDAMQTALGRKIKISTSSPPPVAPPATEEP